MEKEEAAAMDKAWKEAAAARAPDGGRSLEAGRQAAARGGGGRAAAADER